jgi:hypothetical protein
MGSVSKLTRIAKSTITRLDNAGSAMKVMS